MQHILQVWTAPKCQAGAEPIAPLPHTVSASIVEAIGGEESGTISIPAALAQSSGIAHGHVLRALLPLRAAWLEWVLLNVQDGDGEVVPVTLAPLRRLLKLRGFVRTETDGRTVTAFEPRRLTAAAFADEFIFTNRTADGLGWLTPGTFFSSAVIQIPSFSNWTRDEACIAVEKATGGEFVLRALANDAGYALDLVESQNSDRDIVLLEERAHALRIRRSRDLLQTGTLIMPLTGDNTPIGEVDWNGGIPIGSGPFWIPLTDRDNGPTPIREDDQFIGRILGLPDGTALPILDTRASDSAVQVAMLGTYVAGAKVALWEDSAGRPLATIESPSALLTSRGRVVATARVAAATVERNLLENSGLQNGTAPWFDVNGVSLSVDLPRSVLGGTITGAVNGPRAAATGTGTPLALKGLAANVDTIYRGDQIRVAGAVLAVSATAVPSPTGVLALTTTPGLPGGFADDTPLTLVRRDVRALTVASAHSVFSRVFTFTDSNTDNITPGGVFAGRRVVFGAGPLALSADRLGYPDVLDRHAGRLRLLVNEAQYALAIEGATFTLREVSSYVQSVGNTALVYMSAASMAAMTLGTYFSLPGSFVVTSPNAPYVYTRWAYKVTTINVDHVVVTAETTGFGAGESLSAAVPSAGAMFTASGAPIYYAIYSSTEVIASASAATFTDTRENRVLRLNGAYVTGATALTFKAVSALARRDFLSTDTLYVKRPVSALMVWTSVSTFVFDGVTYADFTLNTVASTIDDVAADVSSVNTVYLFFGTSAISRVRITSVSGGVASGYYEVYNGLPPSTGSETLAWDVVDSYPTGAASWTSSGEVTVPITLPVGRSLGRGQYVYTNFHGGDAGARYTLASVLRVKTAVAGAAASVTLYGLDGYRAGWNGASTEPLGVYRVPATNSSFDVPGDTLYAAVTAAVNGLGQASVTLQAANTNALADNAVITVARPALLDADDRTTGRVLRLLSAPGAPVTMATPGVQSSSAFIPLVTGAKTITARAWFAVTADTLSAGNAPLLALVNLTTNEILATATLDVSTVFTPTVSEIPLTLQVELKQPALLALRVYGGSSATFTRWHALKEAVLFVGANKEIVYFDGAGSRIAHHRGQDVLEARKSGERFTVTAIDRAYFSGLGTPLQKGQRVRLRDAFRGIDEVQRIVRLQWAWPGAVLVQIECAALTPRLTDVDVSL